jgi:hypothetical protein
VQQCLLLAAFLLGGCFAGLDESLLLAESMDGGDKTTDMNDGCYRFSRDDIGKKISDISPWTVVAGDDAWEFIPVGEETGLTRPDSQDSNWMVIYDAANGGMLVDYTVRAKMIFREHNVGNGNTRDCVVGHYKDINHYYAACFNYDDYFHIYAEINSELKVQKREYANFDPHELALKFQSSKVFAFIDGMPLADAITGETSVSGTLATSGAVGFRADRRTTFLTLCVSKD